MSINIVRSIRNMIIETIYEWNNAAYVLAASKPLDVDNFDASSSDLCAVRAKLKKYCAIPAGQLSMLESVDFDAECVGAEQAVFCKY